jgi:hypothetical protein
MSYIRTVKLVFAFIIVGATRANALPLTSYEIPVAAVVDPHVDHTGQKVVFLRNGGGAGGSHKYVFVYNLVTTELTQ